MNFQLKVRSKAESDLAEAIRYYEEKVSGLGLKMLTSFNDTIFLISRNPKSFPLIHKQFRRAMIPHFPYGIFFYAEREQHSNCPCILPWAKSRIDKG